MKPNKNNLMIRKCICSSCSVHSCYQIIRFIEKGDANEPENSRYSLINTHTSTPGSAEGGVVLAIKCC